MGELEDLEMQKMNKVDVVSHNIVTQPLIKKPLDITTDHII